MCVSEWDLLARSSIILDMGKKRVNAIEKSKDTPFRRFSGPVM